MILSARSSILRILFFYRLCIIVDTVKKFFECISDDELEKAIIQKMLDEGNKTYEDINEAFLTLNVEPTRV